ncbi:MAG: polyprenyl diphosphate synthase [Candidatus Bathyarchaeia archaeon]
MGENMLNVPKHLALIPDGNRRWALKHNLQPWEGHKFGAEKIEALLNWCLELKIPQVSVYVLSTENLNRPKIEVREVFRLLKQHLLRWEKRDFLSKYDIRVRFFGDFYKIPQPLIRVMSRLMEKTSTYQKSVLNLLVAYSGRYEILEMVKKVVGKLGSRIEITPKLIEENLLISTPVDLVIRTGGEHRLSNLLLWQTAYAEIYVTETLLPDFTRNDFLRAIEWYSDRRRRFGK